MKLRRLPLLFLSATTFVYISFNSCSDGVHAQHHVHDVEEQKAIKKNNTELLSTLDLGDERGDSYALPSLRGKRRRNTSGEGTAIATNTTSTRKSGIRYVPKLASKSGQQIVLMVGPHKAGSTSMQNIALELTSNPALLSKKWNWIAPPIGKPNAKSFAVLPMAIRSACVHEMSSEEAIRVFSAEIAKQWHDGYTNLIMGSEEIDSLNDVQIGELLSVMPPDYESATTIVVTYRSPRLDQLVSLWKEITQTERGGMMYPTMPFKDFILSNRFISIHAMDTMHLIKTFLDRKEGFDVVLIDLAGIKEEGLQIYQVIACELMGEPCDSNTMVPDTIATKPDIIESLTKKHNTRSVKGAIGFTAEQMQDFSDVLMAYDCGFQDVLLQMNGNGNGNKSGRLKVLYDYTFTQNMERCSDLPEPLDEDATLAKLKAILLDPLPVA